MDAHIILDGQSNDIVFNNTGPAPYTPTAQVQIWVPNAALPAGGAWNYMLPGVNTGTPGAPTAWGPEVQEANDWLAAHPDPHDILWIVKTAHGSTGLAQDPTQLDWSPASRGEMFDQATAAANAARHNLDGTPYAFSHWDVAEFMQGETDATDAAKAAAYGVNIRAFIAAARSAWSVEEFVVGRITDSAALPYSAAVRNAQWNLDNGEAPMVDVHTFKTIGFGMQADGLHYDAAGAIALGDAFFDHWIVA